MTTIVVTCSCTVCTVMGDEIISEAVGTQIQEPIRLYPGGPLWLHPSKQGTDEFKMTKSAVARKQLDIADGQQVQYILAVHANGEFMNNPDEYLWAVTHGLSALLSGGEKTLLQYSYHEVLEVRKILFTTDFKHGWMWWDVTDPEHIMRKGMSSGVKR